jgi:hypothetical protein
MLQCVLMMIAMACFSRSHHLCKIQKLLTIYFKSCGLVAKALDTLHSLCITMSQKWSYDGIETLSERAHNAMVQDLSISPWFGIHDNVNIPFKVYEQWLQNQSHFDSGTAGTVIIIKDPDCAMPNFAASRVQFVDGVKSPVTFRNIIELNLKSSGHLKALAIHVVLKFLVGATDFDFENYKYNDSSVFSHPNSTCQLKTGPGTATCQYMLDLLHIEEVSYKGNDRVLEEWFRETKFKATGEQLLIWVGDQLTVSRIRGLKKYRCEDLNLQDCLEFLQPVFGWFHAQITMEHSLHSQYYGTRAGHGLKHAFELLSRKGLQSTSVQGIFHQNIKEGLTHIAAACFCDVWCTVGQVQSLKDLKNLTPEHLKAMAIKIVENFASNCTLDLLSKKPDEEQD